MARFRPIKQFRVSREVCEQLKQSILPGQFKAGDRLLSTEFGEILINMEKTYREKQSPSLIHAVSLLNFLSPRGSNLFDRTKMYTWANTFIHAGRPLTSINPVKREATLLRYTSYPAKLHHSKRTGFEADLASEFLILLSASSIAFFVSTRTISLRYLGEDAVLATG